MTKISAVIITLNEERNIKRCVLAAQKVSDKVIILDSFSTDKTVEIPKELNCTVIQQKWAGFSAQKNKVNSMTSYEYILSLDADEEIGNELISLILKEEKTELSGAFSFNRPTNYSGSWVRYGGWYPDVKTRLILKQDSKWKGEFIHELLELPNNSQTKRVNGDLNHYSYYSYPEHKNRMAKYSELHAKKMNFENKKRVPMKPCLSSFEKFINMYFISFGIFDGKTSFIIVWISAGATHNKYKFLSRLNKV